MSYNQCEICLKLTTDQTKLKEYLNEVLFYYNHYSTLPPTNILRRLESLYTKIIDGFRLIRSRDPEHIDQVIVSYEKSKKWITVCINLYPFPHIQTISL